MVCLLLTQTSWGQWQQVQQVDKDWLVYQPQIKGFMPYIASKHYRFKSKSLRILPAELPNTFLRIQPQSDYHLFVQGSFQQKITKGSLYRFSMDSLAKIYPSQTAVVFTWYANDLVGLPSEVSFERKMPFQAQNSADFMDLTRRDSFLFAPFFAFSFLLLLGLFGLLYAAFPRYFQAYFRFSDWIHWEVKDDAFIQSPFAFPNLVVIAILSFITASLSFFNGLTHAAIDSIVESPENLQAIWFVLSKTVLAFILFLSRYFMFMLFTNLFRLPHVAELHFFKSIQANLQFFTLLFLGLSLYAIYAGPKYVFSLEYLSYGITVYFSIRFIYFFQMFRRSLPVNQLSLFAYLILMEGQVMVFGLRELVFPEYM